MPLSYRHQFSLCVDGGVNEDIVKILDAENIVSGSSVLNNFNPKKTDYAFADSIKIWININMFFKI